MSFRSEVRSFMQKVYEQIISENATITVLRDVIERQAKEINELHDKLLARSLSELKTYTYERLPDLIQL
jgi:hypothetical protein